LTRRWWFGALLGWLFLAGCIAWGWSDFIFFGAQSKILASIAADGSLGPVFWWRMARFSIAVLVLHALFGLTVWICARLMCRGFPSLDRHPAWTLWCSGILFSAFVVAGNVAGYPSSDFASRDSALAAEFLGLVPAGWIALGLAIAMGVAAFRVLRQGEVRVAWPGRPAPMALVAGLAIAGLLALGWFYQEPAAARAGTQAEPNIILIGLDSLRDDVVGTPATGELTPNVDAFLAGSTRFTDTTTPLARTFGSWISILSGRHPVTTNARINLMPRKLVREGETLPKRLKSRGFTTLYATDEVRFANIDASYGFDRVATPPIGASDFLLGEVNDLPLSNLVSPTWAARWLFPNSWANRAVYETYRPAQFIARLRDAVDLASPAFIAVHLTLAHWPYNRAGQPLTRERPLEMRAAYREAVREMDRQFGEVLALLERHGLLRNALVVVLSDHGEGMGRPEDSMMREVQRIEERWGSMWGHGTSVTSPHQYEVLMAFRGYGPSVLPRAGRRVNAPASLEDIAPTVVDFLGRPARTGEFDGVSLSPVLRDEPGAEPALADRIRFTETDFNTPSILRGKFDARKALLEAGLFYEVDHASGWVQLKAGRLTELYAQKERAAFTASTLLAALPTPKGGTRYFIMDRHEHHPRPLEGRPDPGTSPAEAQLWDALHARFPAELAEPAGPR
jgi:sulfatase-like protein